MPACLLLSATYACRRQSRSSRSWCTALQPRARLPERLTDTCGRNVMQLGKRLSLQVCREAKEAGLRTHDQACWPALGFTKLTPAWQLCPPAALSPGGPAAAAAAGASQAGQPCGPVMWAHPPAPPGAAAPAAAARQRSATLQGRQRLLLCKYGELTVCKQPVLLLVLPGREGQSAVILPHLGQGN